ncbi:MAG: PAP/fibrillin family protein [Thermaurantiacus sp.]
MADVTALKIELADLGAQTEMGFRESLRSGARIRALASALEALNGCDEPARAAALLRGRWRLLYSNFGFDRETNLGRLTFNVLPRTEVTVEEMFQEVDPANGHYDNVISYVDADGVPGMVVMVGAYLAVEDARIDIGFNQVLQTGPAGQVRLAIDSDRIPPLASDITYLDDSFRLHRSSTGNLYMFERMDEAPMRWARDA